MTELETMERARMYMQKLANGINPLDDSQVAEGELVNNVRISRCFFYVAQVLDQMIEREKSAPRSEPKQPFDLPFAMRNAFDFSREPIGISEITRRINDLVADENMKKMTTTVLTEWLKDIGFLQTVTNAEGKSRTMPTEQGRNMGIDIQERMGRVGPYTAVVYAERMQHFILDNLDGALQLQNSKTENNNRPWSVEDDAMLRSLLAVGTPVKDMSQTLKRSIATIRSRLKKLGLI